MPTLNSVAGAITNRMPKAISPKGHAIADYITVGAFLIAGALFWRKNKHAAMSSFICGGAELALNLLTDYPGGVKKVISFPAHAKIDLGLAAMTATMPEFMGFKEENEKTFFIAQGGAITVLTNLTNYRDPLRDLEERLSRVA